MEALNATVVLGGPVLGGPVLGGPVLGGQVLGGQVLGSIDGTALPGPAGDEVVMLANVGGGLRVSSMQRVSTLVEDHPQQSLDLLRGWMLEEAP